MVKTEMKKITTLSLLVVCSFLTLTQCALLLNEDGYNPLNRLTEDGLPVFYLHPVPLSGEYYPGTLYYRGKEYQTEIKLRGSSSRRFPMKSFTIKFPDDQLFTDPEYGFTNEKKIALITSFNDNSYIRHRLCFDLWNSMDEEYADNKHIHVKTYSAVVYLNSHYWGLYTVAEFVGGLLMEDHGLNPDGHLYKGETHEADFYEKKNLHEGFDKKNGYPEDGDEDAYKPLEDLIKFVCFTDSNDFVSQVDTVFNLREYEDWWIHAIFTFAADTCNKNAYHYLDPRNPGWRFIPWDFNNSFGQNCQTRRTGPLLEEEFSSYNNIFNRFIEEEEIFTPVKTRFIDFLSSGSAFDISLVLSQIDEYYLEIRDAALKSEKKWKEEYEDYGSWDEREDFTTFEEEIQYIKDWAVQRHAFLLDRYDD
jgi:spore coat protein H